MSAPIIPGFHPDPSICRVGDRYFLATSSFEYFPGVPLYTSTDLLSWELVGNVLDRPSQLTTRAGLDGASGGVYAPTLRHHDGLFWLVTTNIHEVARGHLIVHAENPEGPWSDPVHVAGLVGIDPDLHWDDDGSCRLTWSDVLRGGISQALIDPFEGTVLSEPSSLWQGTGGAHAEGPHLYSRNGWFYLLVAEGGTGAGHMVTVARSRAVDGPFESNPANPILTHRSTSLPVQATGHADLVQLADGGWALVHLGTRPRGSFPRWHTNGRETFLAGIDWVDDWPVVVEGRFEAAEDPQGFVETFDSGSLHPRWVSPGADPAEFARPGPQGLVLAAGRAADATAAERLLATRIEHLEWTVSAEGAGDFALSVRIDDEHQAAVERVGDEVRAKVVIGPLAGIVASERGVPTSASLVVSSIPFDAPPGARKGPDRIVLGYASAGEERHLFTLDGRYLSTEVAGGFTGRMAGIEALGGPATVTRVHCTTPTDTAPTEKDHR
ncbi:glycoside hydrolase family 43 protein [Herbiconiux sp. VKM Ac-2851]|uniref:glycoside hydrolase family 43 protein n=1 Tax=Herbiconiux sp. VKM Ac-2851 TaxID=2739025 RepID=UPI0015633AC5|nr:glycoside hydrolase family 43 protein [Herbiconiux sp. VKM Ac-2851]NQX34509.1 family 43 glycosylhydrolase [Herbiconiux sp. VKM Ac-2851]